MTFFRTLEVLLVFALFSLVAGCKISVMVVEGGEAHLAEVYFASSAPTASFGGHSTTLLTDFGSAGHSAWFYRAP